MKASFLVTFRGKEEKRSVLLKRFGITAQAFNIRISRGLSIEEALTAPLKNQLRITRRLPDGSKNPLYFLRRSLRVRTRSTFLIKGIIRGMKTERLLGADWLTVKNHIESQFEPWMSWDNIGEWQIDHVIPLASAQNRDELLILCRYTNLRPLSAVENMRKGSRVDLKIKDRVISEGDVNEETRNFVLSPENSKGIGHYAAKLTEDQVMSIRERASKGEFHSDLAKEFNMTQTGILRLVQGLNWKHLPILSTPSDSPPVYKFHKINKEIADQMRKLHSEGITQTALVKQFGVSYSVVGRVVNNETWM